MLHIILLILKIIGIILLAILGLFILSVICILFVPIRYKGKGEWYKEKHGKVVISWLFHIVSVHIIYDNGKTGKKIKLFGITLRSRKKNKKNKDNTKKEVTKLTTVSKEVYSDNDDSTEQIKASKNQTITLTEPNKESVIINKANEEKPDTSNNKNKPKKKWWNPFNIIRKIRYKIRSIYDKLKRINQKKNNVFAFLREDDTKIAWRLCKEEIIKLVKYILPTRLKLYMKFGFEDPSTTGKVLGVIYMFYGFTKRFKIYPDFQSKVFEGETSFKGRIRVIRLLITFLKLWRNQQVKNTISRAKQI